MIKIRHQGYRRAVREIMETYSHPTDKRKALIGFYLGASHSDSFELMELSEKVEFRTIFYRLIDFIRIKEKQMVASDAIYDIWKLLKGNQ
tara:strand:- start:1181 stop:1450 length:270 start_codon:yes stop_codon:yes gene_type:complete